MELPPKRNIINERAEQCSVAGGHLLGSFKGLQSNLIHSLVLWPRCFTTKLARMLHKPFGNNEFYIFGWYLMKTVAGLSRNLQCCTLTIEICIAYLGHGSNKNESYHSYTSAGPDTLVSYIALSYPVTYWLPKCDTFGGKKRLLSERDQSISRIGRHRWPWHNNRCSHGASPLLSNPKS